MCLESGIQVPEKKLTLRQQDFKLGQTATNQFKPLKMGQQPSHYLWHKTEAPRSAPSRIDQMQQGCFPQGLKHILGTHVRLFSLTAVSQLTLPLFAGKCPTCPRNWKVWIALSRRRHDRSQQVALAQTMAACRSLRSRWASTMSGLRHIASIWSTSQNFHPSSDEERAHFGTCGIQSQRFASAMPNRTMNRDGSSWLRNPSTLPETPLQGHQMSGRSYPLGTQWAWKRSDRGHRAYGPPMGIGTPLLSSLWSGVWLTTKLPKRWQSRFSSLWVYCLRLCKGYRVGVVLWGLFDGVGAWALSLVNLHHGLHSQALWSSNTHSRLNILSLLAILTCLTSVTRHVINSAAKVTFWAGKVNADNANYKSVSLFE